MGNYLEGNLDFYIKNTTPKNILDCLYHMAYIYYLYKDKTEEVYKQIIEKSGIEELKEFITDDIHENPFPSIDFIGRYYNETEDDECDDFESDKDLINCGIDDYSKYDYYNIWINVCTKYNFQRIDRFIETIINIIKPYLTEDSLNYLGYLKSEDGDFYKQYYFDRNEFYEEQKSREYLCKGCEYLKKEALCNNYDICFRAYKLGCKNQIEVDYGLIDIDKVPSLKKALEDNYGVGN